MSYYLNNPELTPGDRGTPHQYRTEDGVTVCEGDLVYDYYSMEPIIIGESCGDGWFTTLRTDGSRNRSRAGMLNGARICTIGYAKRRGFSGV
jgi:hypothetical protein